MNFTSRLNYMISCSQKFRRIYSKVNTYSPLSAYEMRGTRRLRYGNLLIFGALNVHDLIFTQCRFSSDSDSKIRGFKFKNTEALKDALGHKREQMRETEQKLRVKGEELVRDIKHQKEITEQRLRERKDDFIKDILKTRAKVREKIEGIVERENIYTIPNILCVGRIVMSPYLGLLIIQEHYEFALGLWLVAGVTDVLDGWIARTWSSQSSKIGSFLDPMADKILVGTLFLSLTWQQLIPISLTLLVIARDVALMAAAFVIRYKSLPEPKTLSRYFDPTHATAQLAPTLISKINTAIQLLLVGSTLAAPVVGYVDHPAIHTLWVVTATSTVVSALSYVFTKNTYKYLKK